MHAFGAEVGSDVLTTAQYPNPEARGIAGLPVHTETVAEAQR